MFKLLLGACIGVVATLYVLDPAGTTAQVSNLAETLNAIRLD